MRRRSRLVRCGVVASDRRLPVSCQAARRLIAGAFPMNSTMWKIALRTLARDKSYALLNVAGLALATACCLILGVYLRSELTYDQSHVNHSRIFRIANEFEINGKLDRFVATSIRLRPDDQGRERGRAGVRALPGWRDAEAVHTAWRRRLLLEQRLCCRPERVRGVHAQGDLRGSEDCARRADLCRREPYFRAALLRQGTRSARRSRSTATTRRSHSSSTICQRTLTSSTTCCRAQISRNSRLPTTSTSAAIAYSTSGFIRIC